MRSAGILHSAAFRSNSCHSARLSSPGRTNTNGARRSAAFVTGEPLKLLSHSSSVIDFKLFFKSYFRAIFGRGPITSLTNRPAFPYSFRRDQQEQAASIKELLRFVARFLVFDCRVSKCHFGGNRFPGSSATPSSCRLSTDGGGGQRNNFCGITADLRDFTDGKGR